jgi:low temperature requirement protein LtrA
MPQSSSLFREKAPHEHHRVTYIELFFDLVFVFAVTQLSHLLLAHFTPLGALHTGLLMLAVWWVWVYTSWITNWLDPDRAPVRLLLLVLMLIGLALSTSIPEAFGSRGRVFGIAYTAMQVGRTLFMLRAIPRSDTTLRINFVRILIWFSTSSVLWLVGAFSEGTARLFAWSLALAIEYTSAAVSFWTPRLGASKVSDWNIEGGHLAERCALFVIIALGESVLISGATFAEGSWTISTVASFAVCFTGSVAMWWIYFDKGAEFGSRQIRRAEDPGALGRLAYTYLHLPIIAGIVLAAVSDELLLSHPDGHSHAKVVVSVIGGPLVYLIGVILFKRSLRGWFQPSHVAGIIALTALIPFAERCSPLALGAIATLVLVVVAIWETLSLRHTPTSDVGVAEEIEE